MKEMNRTRKYGISHLPMNLQFFAASDDDSEEEEEEDEGDQDDQPADDKAAKKDTAKTYTQKQLNDMMAREKRQGKNSVLKEFGFKNEKDAKVSFKKYQEWLESQKTDEEKSKEETLKLAETIKEAEERARLAEIKSECVVAGASKENLDDLKLLVNARLGDGDDIASAVSEIKTKYPSLFGGNVTNEDDSSKKGKSGTGSSLKGLGSKKPKDKEENLGARLAAQRVGKRK